MTLASPVNKLLNSLYAGAVEPQLWGAFLQELSAATAISKAALVAHNLANGTHSVFATFGEQLADRDSVAPYERHYWQYDLWTVKFPRRGMFGRVIDGRELWPEDTMRRGVFYNEFLGKLDIGHMTGVAVATSPNSYEALCIYGSPNDDPLGHDQLALVQVLIPHMETAFATRHRLSELELRVRDLENALDQISSSLVLIDVTCKVVFVNKNARTVLDRRDGLALQNGRLAANVTAENDNLRSILAKAVLVSTGKSSRNPGAMQVSRASKKSLKLIVAPFRSDDFVMPGRAVAIVFMNDPDEKPAPPLEVLRVLFNLTPAEGRLAISLLDGNSLSESADLNKVGQETVRSQIKSIFHKTGTRRQGELLRLLAGVSIPGLNP